MGSTTKRTASGGEAQTSCSTSVAREEARVRNFEGRRGGGEHAASPAAFASPPSERGRASAPTASVAAPQAPLRTLWIHKEKLLFALDVLTVSSAFLFSYYLRFRQGWFALPPVEHTVPYLKGAALLTGIWVFLIWRRGGYATGFRGVGAPMLRMRSLVASGVGAIGTLMVISFLYRDMLLSRQVYLTTTVFALAVMILARVLFRWVERDLAGRVPAVKRVLLLGEGRQAHDFAMRLARDFPCYQLVRPESRPRETAESESGATAGPSTLASFSADWPLESIRELYRRAPFHKIVLAQGEMERALGADASFARLVELLNDCEAREVSLYALPDSYDVAVDRSEVASLSGIPLLRLQDAARHPVYAIIKRVTDLVAGCAVLVGGMPLWAGIALAVKATSRGPVFHTQWRVGLHGRRFRMYKFRSMRTGAEAEFAELADPDHLAVPGVKIDRDPRVTRLGRVLRRTSLDEIPQILNVLRGDMSLVGPRPELPCLVDRYDAVARRRLKGKPGITGFQQVMARNEPLAGAMKHDLTYLKEQGPLFDLLVLARTVVAMWRGR